MSDNQTPTTEVLVKPIGYLELNEGSVEILSSNGEAHTVSDDIMMFYEDTVIVNNSASGKISFFNGVAEDIIFGPGDVIDISEEVYLRDDSDLALLAQDSAAEVAALQGAILEGVDPSQTQEAPAAGEQGVDYSLGQSYVVNIDRNPISLLASLGYDTQGSALGHLGLPVFGYLTSGLVRNADTIDFSDKSENRSVDSDVVVLSYSIQGATPAGFILDPATGTWTFSASNAAYANLALGEELSLDVVVEIVSSTGAIVEQTIRITVTGTNDEPTATAEISVEAIDGGNVVSGVVEATDIDGDTLTYSLTEDVAGFTLNTATGAWEFDPSNVAYAGLAVGEETQVVVTVEIADGNGGTTQQEITLNVTGSNDVPTVGGARGLSTGGIAAENGDVLTGMIDANDVDGDTLNYSVTVSVEGFSINENTGEWVFDPTNGLYDELAVGEVKDVTITVLVSDTHGGTVEQDLTIKVVGTNDAPVAEAVKDIDATDIATIVTGSVGATDVDGDTLTYTLADDVAGFTLNEATGAWEFDPSDVAYADLAVGEEAEVVVTINVADGNGGTTQQEITLNLVGTNDAPVAEAVKDIDAADITEVVSGTVGATDVDGDTLTYTLADDVAGFTLNEATGAWEFDPSDVAYADLAVGEEAEVVVTVNVADGNGGTTQQEITLNLVGTNDTPVAEAVKDIDAADIATIVTGSVGATDVDGDTLTYTLADDVAGFTLNTETGAWEFDPSDVAYADLAVGEEAEVIVTVNVADGNGGTTQQEITLNLVGTNDAPVAEATKDIDATNITETVSGTVGATDVDGDTLTYSLAEEVAGFTLNEATGAWEFDPGDVAYADLAVGEEAEVVVTINVADGNGGNTQQEITLNLVGTNDAPVANATKDIDATDITETVSGTVGATDVDGDTLTYTLADDVAGFTLNTETGAWEFDPSDVAYADLAVGEEAEVVVTVNVADGNGGTTQQEITLNLVGTNDAPVAEATKDIDATDITEVVSGTVGATDVDGDTLTHSLAEEVAGFTLNEATGAWEFDPSDVAYADLAVGEEAEIVVTVNVADGNGGTTQQEITLNLVGTNDAPVAEAVKDIDATDIATIVTGTVGATDVDGDTLTYTLADDVAGFTLNEATGAWEFDPSDVAYADLAVGEVAEVVMTVNVADGNSGTTQQEITLNLVGTNDAPVAEATKDIDAADITEVVSGSVGATDVDGDTLTYSLAEEVAGFTLNEATGAWEFDPSDVAYADLAVGEEAEIVVTVNVADGNGGTTQQEITLNLVGTNDAPVAEAIKDIDAADITEVVSGIVGATDVDGDTLTYTLADDVAGFTLNEATGAWEFDPSDVAYADLAVGEEAEVVVTVNVADGNGGTTQQEITLNLVGTNDAPVAEATKDIDATDITEVVSGTVGATDVDGDTLTYSLAEEVAGFTLNTETGAWEFDPSDVAYADLAVGEEAEVVVTVNVADGNGGTTQQEITLNLVGTNDAPVAEAVKDIDATDIATIVTGTVGATDVDGDTLTYTLADDVAGFTLNEATGAWEFDPSDVAYADLAVGEEAEVVVTVNVADGNGGTTQQEITLNLVGTNDAPVAEAVKDIDAANIATIVTGSVGATDVDGDTLIYSLTENIAGFTLNEATGAWEFDPSDAAYADLAVGEEAEVVVTINVADGNGGTTQQEITLNLVGTNDAPVAEAVKDIDATDITEVVSGTVGATDVDGDTLTYSLAEEIAGFTLNTDTGAWKFDPSDVAYADLAVGEDAEVVVTVNVADGNGGTTQQEITLNLVGTNDAPVAEAVKDIDAADIATVVTGTVGATDVDGDTLTYALAEEVAGFTLNEATGAWEFDPSDVAYADLAVGEEAEVVVTVNVADGNGGTTQQEITLNLVGTNDAPVAEATKDIDATDITEVVSGTVGATDVDGDTLTYSLAEEVAGFTLNEATGAWEFDPSDVAYADLAVGEEAEVVVTVNVADGNGGTTQQEITLNLVGTNDAPVANATKDIDATDIATIVTGSVGATDVDGDTLTYSLEEEVAGFTLNTETGAWAFDPSDVAYADLAVGEEAEVVVTVNVADGNGGTTQQEITLNLVGTNDAPVAADQTVTIQEDSAAITLDVLQDSYDVDGDDLVITEATVSSEQGVVSVVGNKIIFTATENFNGTANIQYTVSDGELTDTAEVIVNVSGVDDVSVITGDAESFVYEEDSRKTVENFVYTSGELTITDVDQEDLPTFDIGSVVKADGVQGDLTITEDGAWTYVVDAANELQSLAVGQTLVETFTVSASDGTSQEIQVTVIGQDDDSVIAQNNQVLAFSEDINLPAFPFDLTITDVDDGETPYFETTTLQGEYGYVAYVASSETVGEGTWTYHYDFVKGQELESGQFTEVFTLTATDGTEYTITVNINGVNDVPVVTAELDYVAIEGGETITGQIEASDVDSETLSYVMTSEAPEGFVLANDGSWSFDPALSAYDHLMAGEVQNLAIDVQVSDGQNIVSQTINIALTGTNDLPVAVADTVSVSGTEEIVIDVLENDSDAEGTLVITQASTLDEQGQVTVVNNQLVFVAATGFSGVATINYTIADEDGATATNTVTASVNLVTVDSITSGMTLNADDIAGTVNVTGTALGGDITAGDIVLVAVNGVNYPTQVDGDGNWSIEVVGSELAQDTQVSVSVASTDALGNTVNSQSVQEYTVDISADTGEEAEIIVSESVTDGLLGLTLSGIDSDAESVIVLLNDGVNQLEVNAIQNSVGEWTLIDADISSFNEGELAITATVTDEFGNTATVQKTHIYTLNASPVAVDDETNLSTGLVGEYYGTNSQINNIADFREVVSSKDPDATFIAANIDYAVGSGGIASDDNLQKFLGTDSLTINTDPSDYTDGGLHLQGYIYLEAGDYNFKVYADDGYQILVNGEDVASVDYNQAPTTDVFSQFSITDSGYHSIDMVWWDQGGRYVFQPTLSSDGGETYEVIDSTMLSAAAAPPLSTNMDQAIEINFDSLLENDSDEDGDVLTITGINNAQNGYAYITDTGVIHFIPSVDFSGTGSFDYTISDGNGGYDTATALIQVVDGSLLPTVSVVVSEANSYGLWNGFSSESDAAYVYDNYSSYQTFGNDGNNIYVNNDVTASISLNAGDDKVDIGDDIESGGYISLGDGNNQLIVGGSVNHSIAAGSGDDQVQIGEDLSASINLGNGDNYLSVGQNVNSSASVNVGSGNDEIYVNGNVKSAINLGQGNNTVIISGDLNSSVGASTGHDQVQIQGNANGSLTLGDGNNIVVIGGSLNNSFNVGSGNDQVRIEGDVNNYINLGTGDNTLYIGGNLNAGIGLGSGSDFIVIEGSKASEVYLNAGTGGEDSLVLNGYSLLDYQQNKDNIQTKVVGFENIKLSDGFVLGTDEGAFTDYVINGLDISLEESSSDYIYDLAVDLDTTDSTLNASELKMTLLGVTNTSDIIVRQAGEELVANLDGSYNITLAEGQTTLNDITLESPVELPDLSIETLLTPTSSDNNVENLAIDGFIEGTDGLDVLVGGLGSNVIFGGDDDAEDIMTGASGNDIFVLSTVTDSDHLDTITDFNAAEDAIDITNLLVGVEGSPEADADIDTITAFITEHVQVGQDGSVKIDDKDVAIFTEQTSTFDSNKDGEINEIDEIKVVYHNEEYSINIDG
ncbi:VCBS domain-containing protein [Marinomonas sp.]